MKILLAIVFAPLIVITMTAVAIGSAIWFTGEGRMIRKTEKELNK